MLRQLHLSLVLCSLLMLAVSLLRGQSAEPPQHIMLSNPLKIPTTTLPPGTYAFQVEDRMNDRAIVRISNETTRDHHLVLAVPNSKFRSSGKNGLHLFPGNRNRPEALQAWTDPTTKTTFEFAYPKLEAVALITQSGGSALAVDPSADRLPDNLSLDDMKVVTLWLLSPKRITGDQHGEGVAAVKYSPSKPTQPDGKLLASGAHSNSNRLPKTASGLYLLFAGGLLSLAAALVLRVTRKIFA